MPTHIPRPTVAEFMATDLLTLSPGVDIYEAIDRLLTRNVSGAPVTDAGAELLGVLSEKDCLRVLAKGAEHELPGGTVADFMSKDPETLPADMDIYYAAGRFLAQPYRRFPVVSKGKLVGQISRRDILCAIRVIHRARRL